MSWTTPRTWVAGEVVTAAMLNAQVRDNLFMFGSPEHVGFVPAITGVTTSAQLVRYQLVGKRLQYDFAITLSAAPTGTVTLSLPFAAVTSLGTGLTAARGTVVGLRQTVGQKFGAAVLLSSTTIGFVSDGGTVGWGAGVPVAWASTDVWGGSVSVELA